MFPTRRIITSGGDVYRDQYSLEFDGTNDYVNAGGTFQSTFQGSFTVAGWFKPSDGRPSANQMLFGAYKGDATNGTGKVHFQSVDASGNRSEIVSITVSLTNQS